MQEKLNSFLHSIILDLNNSRKLIIAWKMKNSFLNKKWVNIKINKQMEDFLEFNEKKYITYPN